MAKILIGNIKGVKGDTGPQGAKGDTGATGTRGSRWSTGTAITGTSTTATVFSGTGLSDSLVNDMYLNKSTGYVYRCTVAGNASTAKWVYVGSIKGATGSTPSLSNYAYIQKNSLSANNSVTLSFSGKEKVYILFVEAYMTAGYNSYFTSGSVILTGVYLITNSLTTSDNSSVSMSTRTTTVHPIYEKISNPNATISDFVTIEGSTSGGGVKITSKNEYVPVKYQYIQLN